MCSARAVARCAWGTVAAVANGVRVCRTRVAAVGRGAGWGVGGGGGRGGVGVWGGGGWSTPPTV